MKPIIKGELENEIHSATVLFINTGETKTLSTKDNSACHFFERFTVGNDEIQLRLDWSQIDPYHYPTLDADFYNTKTRAKRSLKRGRKHAHHTSAKKDQGRIYSWVYNDYEIDFKVQIHWLARGEFVLKVKMKGEASVIKGVAKS